MSEFFEKPLGELLKEEKQSTEEKDKEEQKTIEERLKQAALNDMREMIEESRQSSNLVYPESVRPHWKN